jgi:hypothetical protein
VRNGDNRVGSAIEERKSDDRSPPRWRRLQRLPVRAVGVTHEDALEGRGEDHVGTGGDDGDARGSTAQTLGTWLSARRQGPVRWRRPPWVDLARRGIGGVLMGAGGTLAAGCNIGNALTGLSILAVNSVIATMAIIVGGAAAIFAGAGLATWPGPLNVSRAPDPRSF